VSAPLFLLAGELLRPRLAGREVAGADFPSPPSRLARRAWPPLWERRREVLWLLRTAGSAGCAPFSPELAVMPSAGTSFLGSRFFSGPLGPSSPTGSSAGGR